MEVLSLVLLRWGYPSPFFAIGTLAAAIGLILLGIWDALSLPFLLQGLLLLIMTYGLSSSYRRVFAEDPNTDRFFAL